MDHDVRHWGEFSVIDRGPDYTVKRLTVWPGKRLSLQHHEHRSEHWAVVHGEAEVTRDGEVFRMTVGHTCDIPCRAKHRLANPGTQNLVIVEIWYGGETSEDDIVRHPD